MVIKGNEAEFAKIPTLVTVRKHISKAGHQFFSFLPEQGCEYLRQYWIDYVYCKS